MKKAVKIIVITAGVIVFLGAAGSVGMGGYVADRILHQNDGKDTQANSVKQLELWGYDLDSFYGNYEGTDMYNNITGKAYEGNNFLVINGEFPNGNSITFSKPVTIIGFQYTNAAATANSIVNGDDFSGGAFTNDDWLKCIVKGTRQNGDSVTYDIALAEKGTYVNKWKATTGMNKNFTNIVKLEFSFVGTRKSQGGLITPAFMCLDNIVLQ